MEFNFLRCCRRFFRRRYWDEERARELEAYLEIEMDENIARGMLREEARHAAHRKLGNMTLIREEIYHMNSLGWLETLWQDLRYAIRMLGKNRGFTAVAIITLAFGIGVNIAAFSVVNTTILRPLPYQDVDRLFTIGRLDAKTGEYSSATLPEFSYWQAHSRGFTELAAINMSSKHIGAGEQSGPVGVMSTSANYFKVLGVQPHLGRSFLPGEDRTGFNHIAVLSDGLWVRAFGSDPRVIGRSLQLDGASYSIVGVMPREFYDPNMGSAADLWIPLTIDSPPGHQEKWEWPVVLGRVDPDVKPEQARSQLEAVARAWELLDPKTAPNLHLEFYEMERMAKGWTSPFLVLFGAASFILLIACVNFANLLTARANARRKEIAVRTALGAGRLRLIRQVLTETLTLTLSGGVAAVLVAKWALPILISASPEGFPRLRETTIDGKALAYALLICTLAGVAVGLASVLRPVTSESGSALCGWLKESPLGVVQTFRGGRGGRALVVCEIALALPLSLGAGLMTRTFLNLRPVNLGFDPRDKLIVSVKVPRTCRNAPDRRAFFEDLVQRLQAVPAVKAVCGVNSYPMGDNSPLTQVRALGRTNEPREPWVRLRVVSDNYFQLMRVQRLSGRFLTKSDSQNGPAAAVINQTMAEAFWPGEDPLGKQLILPEIDPHKVWSVAGVAGDERIRSTDTRGHSQIYVSYPQPPEPWVDLIIQTIAAPRKLTGVVRKQLLSVDKDIDIFSIITMEHMLAKSVQRPRFFSVLLGIFAVLALALASVGIYGVMSYSVSQRTHEMGVRVALGAQRSDVMKLVLTQGLILTALGIAVGLGLGAGLTRFLGALLYAVRPTDPLTFVAVSLLLLAVALIAVYIPARGATKVDPMVALRYE